MVTPQRVMELTPAKAPVRITTRPEDMHDSFGGMVVVPGSVDTKMLATMSLLRLGDDPPRL